jgi:predicted PurR-regulated permease PerM
MPSGVRRVRVGAVLVAVVLTALGLWIVAVTADILLLLFLAVLMALYLGAVRDYIVRRLRLPSLLAFWIAVIGTLAATVGLLWLLVPPVLEQTRGLIATVPGQLQIWDAWVTQALAQMPGMSDVVAKLGPHALTGQIYGFLSDRLPSLFGDVSKRVLSVLGVALALFTVAVMSIYLALYPGVYREWLIVLFPPVYRDLVRDVLDGLGDTMRAYIVGQLSTMFILGGLTAIGLAAVGVPYWLTFGVFSGFAALIPVFGVLLATVLPALFVLGSGAGLSKALLVIGVGVVVHVIDGNLVSPLVMSKRVDLPPVLTMLAALIAGSLLGPLGLVVAVPLLACIMVVVRRILIERIYAGRGFRRARRDRSMVLRVPAPEGGVRVADPAGANAVDMIALSEQTADG